jgi:hypothetical protein
MICLAPAVLQTVAEPCDVSNAPPISFLAGSSSDPSGRPLTRYMWRQQQVNPVLGDLIAAVNARNNGRWVARFQLLTIACSQH